MAHALVTGAAGFIGSTLTDRLLADGVRVTGVDAFTDYYDVSLKRRNIATALAHQGFELLELDLGTADLAPLPEVDVVFHNAAQPGVRASWGREFSPYRVTKLAGEHLALLYGRNFGLPVAALRYFTVYGPRQRPDMAFHRFCRALWLNEPLTVYGDGKQSRDFTFIDDAIEANLRAWRRAALNAVYNVGGGSQVEVLEAIAILERACGAKARVDFKPLPPGDPPRTRADASRLRADLGWAPATPIERGLAAEAEWTRGLYQGSGR